MFLYDVTSSYLEGKFNEYAAYGYNRNKKKGKKQIVIGLLTDHEGDPISVQVFRGNTKDNLTVVEQVHKIYEQFNVKTLTFVRDRGMIKKNQLDKFSDDFRYITAITKPEVKKLIDAGKIKLKHFSDDVYEVSDGGIRYVLRRNPVRQNEIQNSRQEKWTEVQKFTKERNEYLRKHPKARVPTAVRRIRTKAKILKIYGWVKIRKKPKKREILVKEDDNALKKESLLDGCDVIKTILPTSHEASSQTVHDRYKDLIEIGWAFRTMKSSFLEIRPHYVRKATRTDGHVFVVMLAYKIIRYLQEAWKTLEITVEEGIYELSLICSLAVSGQDPLVQLIPQPSNLAKELIEAVDVVLPEVLISKGINVATRKKLLERRQESES